jgi:hypothetical protein
MLLDFLSTDFSSAHHSDNVDAGTSEWKNLSILSHVDDILDKWGLLNKPEPVLIRSDVTQSPQNGSLLLGACGILKQFLPEFVDVIASLDQLSSLFGLDELTKEVTRSLDHLVFLRKNLYFEDDLLQEGFEPLAVNRSWRNILTLGIEHLVWFLAQLTVIFAKLEMNTIPDDLEFVNAKLIVHISYLSLLSDIGLDPLGFNGFLALMVNELAAQLEASADEVCAF